MTTSCPRTDDCPHSPSRRMVRGLLLLLLAGVSALATAPASAQSCWVNTGPTLAFGEVGTSGKTTSGNLSLTCQRDYFQFAAFRVCMNIPADSPGGAPSPAIDPRWMTNHNGAYLAYDLYSDAARMRMLGPHGSGHPTYSTSFQMFRVAVLSHTFDMPIYAHARPGQRLPAAHPFEHQIGGGQLRYAYNVPGFLNPFPTAPTEAQCLSGSGADGAGEVQFHTIVTATFANTCRITTATDLDFGAVTVLSGNRDQTSTIQLQCPAGTVWRVGLNNGNHANGNTRRMAGPDGRHLQYELYRDSQRTQRWGNTPDTDTGNGIGTNASQSLTVYGRVPAQAAPRPGTYSDTVTVTLTY